MSIPQALEKTGIFAVDYLHNKLGISYNNILLDGYSLGGLCALKTASHFAKQGVKLPVALHHTFSRIRDVVRSQAISFIQENRLKDFHTYCYDCASRNVLVRVTLAVWNLLIYPLYISLHLLTGLISILINGIQGNLSECAQEGLQLCKLAVVGTFAIVLLNPLNLFTSLFTQAGSQLERKICCIIEKEDGSNALMYRLVLSTFMKKIIDGILWYTKQSEGDNLTALTSLKEHSIFIGQSHKGKDTAIRDKIAALADHLSYPTPANWTIHREALSHDWMLHYTEAYREFLQRIGFVN